MAFEDIKFPYSLEAEQAVLGALVVEPDLINDIALMLRPEHFYIREHAEIYEILIKMSDLNRPIDFVTLLEEVKSAGVYGDDEEAKEYLVNLAQTVPTSHNVRNYARIVADDYLLRSLITASRSNIEDATKRGADVREVMDSAENRIYGIMNDRDRITLTPINEAMKASLKNMEDLSDDEKRKEIIGVKTGFSCVDYYITGLRKSDLVFVAGRPGFGKTSLALNIATNVAKNSGKGVAYFSLEMSAEQLATRVLASEAMIDSRRMMRGELEDEDWVSLANTYESLSRLPIYFDDTSNITLTEMKAKLRRLKNVNIGLVIIDYLQLMTTGRHTDNRANEVQELSRNMKIMARELGVAVMCCAQLNRDAAKRSLSSKGDGKPVLSDLRESGSIEQDADMVMLLYKKDKYDDTEDKDTVECIVAKNRHGETGSGFLRWIGKYTRFVALDLKRQDS